MEYIYTTQITVIFQITSALTVLLVSTSKVQTATVYPTTLALIMNGWALVSTLQLKTVYRTTPVLTIDIMA
jgi:hypothetical protein